MIEIRNSVPADLAAIEALYADVFLDEDLVPLVRALLNESAGAVSLLATTGSSLLGHVIFTMATVAGRDETVALLGPLAVTPANQKQGIGTALVHRGLLELRAAGARLVLVLGDPAYYSRLGFQTERNVATPYAIPAEWQDAWQSRVLDENAPPFSGTLLLPRPWQNAALWAP